MTPPPPEGQQGFTENEFGDEGSTFGMGILPEVLTLKGGKKKQFCYVHGWFGRNDLECHTKKADKDAVFDVIVSTA